MIQYCLWELHISLATRFHLHSFPEETFCRAGRGINGNRKILSIICFHFYIIKPNSIFTDIILTSHSNFNPMKCHRSVDSSYKYTQKTRPIAVIAIYKKCCLNSHPSAADQDSISGTLFSSIELLHPSHGHTCCWSSTAFLKQQTSYGQYAANIQYTQLYITHVWLIHQYKTLLLVTRLRDGGFSTVSVLPSIFFCQRWCICFWSSVLFFLKIWNREVFVTFGYCICTYISSHKNTSEKKKLSFRGNTIFFPAGCFQTCFLTNFTFIRCCMPTDSQKIIQFPLRHPIRSWSKNLSHS